MRVPHRQYVLWIATPSRTRPGKTDKMPIHPHTGQPADHGRDDVRLNCDEAHMLHALGIGHGVGFVFTEDDPFFFLDIDNALQGGQWSDLAQQLCAAYAGCYVEVSYSGTGLHIIGSTPPLEHGTRNASLGLELYTKSRFVALTGHHASGSAEHVADLQHVLALPGWSGAAAAVELEEWTDGPCAEWDGPLDDQELIRRMLASRPSAAMMFGSRLTIPELWGGADQGDTSAGDAALCAHLAFWTGKDCERIRRLFEQSGRVRDKWIERPDYQQRTILKEVSRCNAVCGEGNRPPADDTPVAPPRPTLEGEWREGCQILTIPRQVEHFAGCVYVRDQHRVLVPDGGLLKPEQFRTQYGGYQFTVDSQGTKTIKNAWEAFTESQGYKYPWAHDVCFRPECPPGGLIEDEGRCLVNTYVPITTKRRTGDATPFLKHCALLLPDERDRSILLSYMAALVQHPGVKFQWCPVIQGVEGNGKTLLVSCLEHAVGSRYSHRPNAQDIANKFTGWLVDKMFIAVEEVYVSDRQDVMDTLKALITNSRVEVQRKGQDQYTADNRANFMLSSNHRDCVRKTGHDRRYCILYTAQQEAGDLARDGMTGDYFPNLYNWLRDGGYEIVNDWLRTYQIPDELNPAAACHRAPVTSSTAAAIRASLGTVEQEVLEAVEEGRPGFAGGWISSLALDRLLDEKRLAGRMPRAKRREMLQGLGYDYHPALIEGRVNNPIGIDGGKPRLYIRKGHLAANLKSCAEVVRCYSEAQSGGAVERMQQALKSPGG